MTTSFQALALLAVLLEEAENTVSICEDVAPWCDRKPLIEELWKLYSDQMDLLKPYEPQFEKVQGLLNELL